MEELSLAPDDGWIMTCGPTPRTMEDLRARVALLRTMVEIRSLATCDEPAEMEFVNEPIRTLARVEASYHGGLKGVIVGNELTFEFGDLSTWTP